MFATQLFNIQLEIGTSVVCFEMVELHDIILIKISIFIYQRNSVEQ